MMVKRITTVEREGFAETPGYPMATEKLTVPYGMTPVSLARWLTYTPAQGFFPSYCQVEVGADTPTHHQCPDHDIVLTWAPRGHYYSVSQMSEIAMRVTPWDDKVEVHAWPRFEERDGREAPKMHREFTWDKPADCRVVIVPPSWWESLWGITWEFKIARAKARAMTHVAHYEAHKHDAHRRAEAVVQRVQEG